MIAVQNQPATVDDWILKQGSQAFVNNDQNLI